MDESMQAPPLTNICPACGAAFTCGMTAGLEACWCASLPPVLAVPAADAGQCYCPECLRKVIAEAEAR